MQVGGDDEKVRKAMIDAMLDVWGDVGDQLMHDLIDSMTTRVNAVLEAEGWHMRFEEIIAQAEN